MSSLEYHRNYYRIHKAEFKKKAQAYYQSHKDEVVRRTDEWRKAHKDQERLWASGYRKSFLGHLNRLWYSLDRRVKVQKGYIGMRVDFDRKWLLNFGQKSDEYHRLYSQWVDSKFERKLIPTIDRINNKLGYLKSNIQFLTSSDNSRKKAQDNGIRSS